MCIDAVYKVLKPDIVSLAPCLCVMKTLCFRVLKTDCHYVYCVTYALSSNVLLCKLATN